MDRDAAVRRSVDLLGLEARRPFTAGLEPFFPWFSRSGRKALWHETHTLIRFRLSAIPVEGALSGAAHGLGLLAASGMAVSGVLQYLVLENYVQSHALFDVAQGAHELLGALTWAYLIGHSGDGHFALVVRTPITATNIFAQCVTLFNKRPTDMRILLVEDDPMIGKAVQQGLRNAGFSVDWAQDGRAAELSIDNDVYHLVVLDLGLPRKDGIEVLKSIRAKRNSIPVLITTARDAVSDRVAGLNAGADDYVIKPFDLDELIARVHALLRRHAGSGSPILECGELRLDPISKSVMLQGKVVDLSAREFSVLEALMQKPGAVLSRETLEEAVYGWGEEVGSNAIEVHLHNLRKKLGVNVIKNVRGVGYRVAKI